jgi:hypothetical protein
LVVSTRKREPGVSAWLFSFARHAELEKRSSFCRCPVLDFSTRQPADYKKGSVAAMPHLNITRKTPVTEIAEELRETLIEAKADLEQCSPFSFSGIPVAQKVMPTFDETDELIPLIVWLVKTEKKRWFIYVPSTIDQQTLMVLNQGKFAGIGSECLDVAKVVKEIPRKVARQIEREGERD